MEPILDENARKKLEEIYSCYRRDMFITAYSILKDKHAAEDAVQNAILKIYRHLDKIPEVKCKKTRAYIVIIVRNICLDHLRGKRDIDSLDYIPEAKQDDEINLDDYLVKIEKSVEVARQLNKLHRPYADILVLRYYHELSVSEIADLLGITEGNVSVRLHRALGALRNIQKRRDTGLKKLEDNDRLLNQKKSELLLYSIENEYADTVSDETDALLDEYRNVEVPESLDNWIVDLQKESKKLENKIKHRRMISKIGKCAAIVVAVVSVFTATATLSVEALRTKFFNMIIEVGEKYSLIRFESTELVDLTDKLPADWDGYYPTVLPEGYEFSSAVNFETMKSITFISDKGEELYFSQLPITGEHHLDTENAKVSEIKINGMEGLTIEKEGLCIVVWHDNRYSLYLGGNVDKSLLIKAAESVAKK